MAAPRAALAWAGFSAAALLCSMAWAQLPDGPSIPMEYCSTVNTADMTPFHSIYQSDGRCFGNCTDHKYALAIVQDKNCWCSNMIPNPADRKPLTDCEAPCPGFPSDHCGGDGVYGYMEVSGFRPSGTAPPGGPPTRSPSSSSRRSTAQRTVTVTMPVPSPSASSTLSSSSSSSAAASSTPSDDDAPSVTTITVGGVVQTVTATPDPTSSGGNAQTGGGSSGLQTGAIVGIVIGVVGGLAVLGVFVWLWLAKRRRDRDADHHGGGSPARSGGSPGAAASATPQMGEASDGRYAGSAASAAAAGPWDAQNKRRSHLMPVDPRLDPFIYASDHNRSRESFNSLQDNQDYSRRVHQPQRVLRATNPDPDVD